MPTMQDAQLRYGQSRGYGAFVDMVDKDGKIIMTTGHGDVRGARTGTVDLSPPKPAKPSVEPVQEVKPDPKAQEVSLSSPAATNFIQQQPGSNNVAMVQVPSESKPPQRSSVPPPATTPSTVQNVDFSLSVHNPDNAAVFLTHQMLNVAVG
jgi:hypothetical protein